MTSTTAEQALPTAPSRDAGRGGVALLIIDMMNCFDFAGAPRLRPRAKRTIGPILALRDTMQHLEAPTVYVNDNFGEWHSEKSKLVERAAEQAPDIAGPLAPRDEDYFIIKPQFSGFYATNLPLLLPKLGVSRLVLTGIAADICVLFTAADAHMRDYALWVPQDAVAAEVDAREEAALELMREHLGAETAATSELDVPSWMKTLDERGVR
jgi:nicotinamidase-related amidase